MAFRGQRLDDFISGGWNGLTDCTLLHHIEILFLLRSFHIFKGSIDSPGNNLRNRSALELIPCNARTDCIPFRCALRARQTRLHHAAASAEAPSASDPTTSGSLKTTGRGQSPWRQEKASEDALCLTVLKSSSIPFGTTPATPPLARLRPKAPGKENSAQSKLEGELPQIRSSSSEQVYAPCQRSSSRQSLTFPASEGRAMIW